MAAKKKKAPNKTAYILGLPSTMAAKDVVKKAAAEGIKLSVAYVYGVRSKGKSKGQSKSRKPRAKSTTAEHDFLHHAFTVGFDRASHLLESVRAFMTRRGE